MKVPLSWLNEYVNITLPVPELAERMTMAGLEVTGIEYVGIEPPSDLGGASSGGGISWDRETVFVGQILEVRPHPNADRLTLAVVDYGQGEPQTVVTGAPNIRVGESGQKVPFATIGARLIDGHRDDGRLLTLKAGKIRGVSSEGMVLSEKELGLSNDHTGIIILPDDAPVGLPLADYMGDVVLEIDILPSIARCMSVIGVAREVAALTSEPLKVQEPAMMAEGEAIDPLVTIEIEDSDLCSRYSATLIRDVSIGPSPFWMHSRLRMVGIRPISNIVDITNYVMLEWGQPLHAFDYDKLVERAGGGAPNIIVRRSHEGERLTTLDDVERTLTTDMLLIADTAGAIAIAGVMGGLETEVTEDSRNILLESANFHYINNRRTSQALRLPSEATARFGRGVPAETTVRAATRASEFMRSLAGGTVAQGVADAYPAPQEAHVVEITTAEVTRILGMNVSVERMEDILTALEFQVEKADGVLHCTVPWYRLDVSIPADLIEEVARINGYDQIPTTLMADELPPQRRNRALETEEQVRDILIGCGLQDTITYALVGQDANHRLLTPLPQPERGYTGRDIIPAILPPETCIRLANPLTTAHDTMRSTLLPSALMALSSNLRFADRLAQFEIGRVYWPREGEPLPDEPRHLSIAMTGPRETDSWLGSSDSLLDFFDLKGVIETLLDRLGVVGAQFVATEHAAFTPRVARLLIGEQDVGILGEVHPQVRHAFDLPDQQVCLAEIDLSSLTAATDRLNALETISQFPAVLEDLAVVVDESVTSEQVAKVMREAGGELLRAIELFDLYRGEAIRAGSKSLAYRLTYQAKDRTLSAKDMARMRNRIVKRLQSDLGANLRS